MNRENETQEVTLPSKGAVIGLARATLLEKRARKRVPKTNQGHQASKESGKALRHPRVVKPGLESRPLKFQSNIYTDSQ